MATFKPALRKQTSKLSATSPMAPAVDRSPSACIAQEMFLEMLRRERRRTERSGRPFMLVMISGWDLDPETRGNSAGSIVKALSSCIRETDVLGWYEQDTTLALMMTEIGETSAGTVETIVQKISEVLQRSLPAETYCRLALVVRLFPDDEKDRVFYPDQSNRQGGVMIDHLLKRTIDFVGSIAALVLFSPAFLVIAVLVKCTSRGPILFCQARIGRHGKEFCFYKFRTMSANNDPHIHREYISRLIAGGAEAAQTDGSYKLRNDPRVTSLGRFLRRTSLDELPQFINVLFNDMSLVGPRPPLPYEYERYRTWHRRRVLELKPGITGLWQVEGRSRTTFDEMVRMDIRYARIRSIWLDLKIMLQTPAAMFFGNGAC